LAIDLDGFGETLLQSHRIGGAYKLRLDCYIMCIRSKTETLYLIICIKMKCRLHVTIIPVSKNTFQLTYSNRVSDPTCSIACLDIPAEELIPAHAHASDTRADDATTRDTPRPPTPNM
jgi:hypothetical protein